MILIMPRIICLTFVVFGFSAIAAEKPDIVMIAIDDLRPMLGCYGDERISTPNIDKLAARGVVFERAYCQYAKCGTSRLSLMTGLRPNAVNVFSNNERDVKRFRKERPDAVSMAKWLKNKAGYHTQSWGKIYHDGWDDPADWTVASSPGREREMWEVFDSKNPSETKIAERWDCPVMQSPDVADDFLFAGRMTNDVIKFLKRRRELSSARMPVFLAVGYRRPHLPFVAPKKYFDLYQPDESWLARNLLPAKKSPVMAWFNSDGYVGGAKRLGLTMPSPPNREEGIAWNGFEMRSYLGVPPEGEISKELQLELLHAYAACVSYVDAQIGRLLAEVSEDAIVILWSDHGWHLGEQSAWGKMTNFEIATRVPLIIAHPKLKPGRTKALAELVDLYPTICDFASVEKPEHLQGESLLPILEGQKAPVESSALSQYARFGTKFMGYALRTDRYRTVVWIEQKSNKQVGVEIYDHENDSQEMQNLAGDDSTLDQKLIAATRDQHGLD